ncbi:glutathione transferase gst 23-like protein [Trifolium pratense]|uniref:glutathione transferase n=1 Tax=Trifolium pratense TaxID=57577 RepID=A0A2K3P6I0_TRIPR|nr:glutathione transferase gst 23-like protein [Trifolium pratense]
MEDIKVFGLWSSPFSQRVLWTLKLKGVSYEYYDEDLANKSNLLLQYNPIYKKVPVLVHNGKPISESMVIVQYIDETWPQIPLLPQDAYERAKARFWSKFIEEKSMQMMEFFLYDGERQERAIKETLDILRVIENESGLSEKMFICGNTIGLADIALGWVAHTLPVMEEIVGVKFITIDAFPHLHSWVKNFLEIPIIKNNLPPHEKLVEYFRERRKVFLAMASHHHHH